MVIACRQSPPLLAQGKLYRGAQSYHIQALYHIACIVLAHISKRAAMCIWPLLSKNNYQWRTGCDDEVSEWWQTVWWSRRRLFRSQILRKLHPSISYVICHIHKDGRKKLAAVTLSTSLSCFWWRCRWWQRHFCSSDADGWLGSSGWLESLPGLLESLPGWSGILLDGWSLLGWLECVFNLLLNLLPEVGWLCFWLAGPPKGAL